MLAVDYGYDHVIDTLIDAGTKVDGKSICI